MGKHKPQHANGSTNEGGSKKDPEFYARLWFDALARFNRVGDPGNWQFTEQDVIDFLRSKLKQGCRPGKRLRSWKGSLVSQPCAQVGHAPVRDDSIHLAENRLE